MNNKEILNEISNKLNEVAERISEFDELPHYIPLTIEDLQIEIKIVNTKPNCMDCLCRVCNKNVCGDGEGCEGCNSCEGIIVDTPEDCPTGSYEYSD